MAFRPIWIVCINWRLYDQVRRWCYPSLITSGPTPKAGATLEQGRRSRRSRRSSSSSKKRKRSRRRNSRRKNSRSSRRISDSRSMSKRRWRRSSRRIRSRSSSRMEQQQQVVLGICLYFSWYLCGIRYFIIHHISPTDLQKEQIWMGVGPVVWGGDAVLSFLLLLLT